MIILRQKEFNSRKQKLRRMLNDVRIGQNRLEKLSPESAEASLFWAKATYPGENIHTAIREGDNFRFKGELRPGVSEEKAKRLEEAARKLKEQNPKQFRLNQLLTAGREKNHGTSGYSDDLSNINHRINSRYSGETSLKDDFKKKKEVKKSIAKHEAKAAELRAKKEAAEKLKKNLKTGGKIALGTVAAAGLAYGGKKAYDKYKKKKEEEK